MPCTLVIRLNGKFLFSKAGMPEQEAKLWASDFEKLMKGGRDKIETEIIPEIDSLPTPEEVATGLVAQQDKLVASGQLSA